MNVRPGRKLLVIDDDPAACGVLEAAFSPRGFEVLTVSDPASALEKAKETGPELIFISLLLPGTNGLKVSKSLHSTAGLENIPVLMMISHAGELDPKYTTTIGIVDVLVKPLNSEEVLGKVLPILETAPEISPSEDESPYAYSLDDEEVAEAIAFPEESPVSESAAAQVSAGKTDVPREETGLYADLAEEGKDFDAGLDRPSGGEAEQPHEETDEYAYEDEYDSYKDTEKQTTKKIVLLASSLFIIVLLGIGVFFMKDSLFSPKKDIPQAVVPQPQPDMKPSPEPAAKPQEALPQAKTETASMPAVTKGREMPPAAISEKAPKEAVVKQPPPSAEQPKQPAARTGRPAPEKISKTQAAPAKKTFTVQVGVFESKKNADALAGKLSKKGYAAVVLKDAGKNGKPLYRVTAGSFDSRVKADQQSRALLEKEGIKSIVR